MRLRQVLHYLVLVLCLLPVLIGFLYVFLFGVNVVTWGQMESVAIFEKYFNGTLTFSDLFFQHNEHRLFFPRILILLLGIASNYNNLLEMYFVQIFFLITLTLFFLVFKKQFDFKKQYLWFVPLPFLVFSLRQYANMLYGFHLVLVFPNIFCFLAFYFIFLMGENKKQGEAPAYIAAVGSATIATFSQAQGLFAWPAGLLQIALLPLERAKKFFYGGIWILLFALEGWLYFLNYQKPMHQPSVLYSLSHPLMALEYFFKILGGALLGKEGTALAGGIIITGLGLICLFFLFKNDRLKENSFWLAVAGFSLITVFSITLGRAGLGAGQGLTPRYASFTLPLVIALYVMLLDLITPRRRLIPLAGIIILLGFITFSIPEAYAKGFASGSKIRAESARRAFILADYESQPDEFLKTISPEVKEVKASAFILKKLGYNVFSKKQGNIYPLLSDLVPLSSPTFFSLDTINQFEINKQEPRLIINSDAGFVIIRGWAVDAGARKTAGGVYLDLDGKLYPAFYGMIRKDVAKRFKASSYRYSGFERAIPLSDLGPGLHRLTLKILTKDRKAYYQPEPTVSFEIK